MSSDGLALGGGTGEGASSSGRTPARVHMRPDQLPLDLLVARHNPATPPSVLATPEEQRRIRRDVHWSQKREYVLAAVAAGLHVLWFSFNLAFWGTEGMAPDRYWPDNPRIRLGIHPGRYGNLQGAKRVMYRYMGTIEGSAAPRANPK